MAETKKRFKTNLGKALSKLSQNSRVLGNFIELDTAGANPKYELFYNTGIRRREGLANNAVSVTYDKPNEKFAQGVFGRYPYGSIYYSTLNDNKSARLYEYRMMAQYSEILNALEHITNEFITVDDRGRVATMRYSKPNADVVEESTLLDEFDYFQKLFNFEEKGSSYCWRYLVEGEVFLELIVNDAKPENLKEGILGVIDISADLVDTIWKSKAARVIDSFIGRKPIYDPNDGNKIQKIELVPYQANQLFYVYSGQWDADGEYMVPFIERARRRYIQLSYIEDAIVIYRLVRAPERLVFTIPTGNMTPSAAERYLKTLMDNYWKSKVMDINTGDISQRYNPQAMTDAYYFAKPMNGEAISVTSLKGGDNLGEIKDLDFFLKALYRDLKVPSSYLNFSEKAVNSDPSQILVEELRFADFITDIQRSFAYALKQAFITHLKFKGLWQRYHLHENHIDIKFNQPGSYYLMRELQIAQMRNDIFNAISSNEIISKIYALKKYFDWSDKEILANIAFLKTEAALLWEIEQRRLYGPTWKNMITGEGGEQPGGGMGGEGLPGEGINLGGGSPGGEMGGSENPPEFGGGPAATSEIGAPDENAGDIQSI